MVTRVLVNGARGKMGVLACAAIDNHPDFELVAGLSRQDNLSSAIVNTNAHIVIDLTRADCVYENSLTIINSGAHPVIGSSGLQHKQIEMLTELCDKKQLGGIIAPNFSISAVLMMRFAEQAAHYLPDVEIIEYHHPKKYDAPSGTAIKTAEMIASKRQQDASTSLIHEVTPDVRGGQHAGISIHSLRLPGVVARQDIIFGGLGETLTITHNSINRESFMPGIILCCKKVQQLHSLYYGLEKILA